MTARLTCFSEFNALRKNQLLAFYPQIAPLLHGCAPYPNPNPNCNPNRIGRPPLALPSPLALALTLPLPLRQPLPLTSVGRRGSTKYRDYYFLAQYEAGQPELVQLHHYTYEVTARARTRARVS